MPPTGIPPPIVLPMTSMSGSRPQALRRPAGPGADRVGLVDDQERAGPPRDLADGLVVAGLGQDDPDVGQGRLEEDGRDVAVGERALRARRCR